MRVKGQLVTHKRREVLLVVGGTASMAEGTAGVESAGRTEKAAAARPEALGPGRMRKHGARPFEVVRWYRLMDA